MVRDPLRGLLGQAFGVFAAILLVPGITSSFESAFRASWIVAGIGTPAPWLSSARFGTRAAPVRLWAIAEILDVLVSR